MCRKDPDGTCFLYQEIADKVNEHNTHYVDVIVVTETSLGHHIVSISWEHGPFGLHLRHMPSIVVDITEEKSRSFRICTELARYMAGNVIDLLVAISVSVRMSCRFVSCVTVSALVRVGSLCTPAALTAHLLRTCLLPPPTRCKL